MFYDHSSQLQCSPIIFVQVQISYANHNGRGSKELGQYQGTACVLIYFPSAGLLYRSIVSDDPQKQ